MARNTQIIVGNLARDPELRYTASGKPVANVTIADSNSRFNKDTQQWEDQEALFLSGTVWEGTAENVAESLKKGDHVIATGTLKPRTFTTKEGDTRTIMELQIDAIGPNLVRQTAQVTKNAKKDNGGNNGGYNNRAQAPQSAPSGYSNDASGEPPF